MDMKPRKHTTGATLMRRTLKLADDDDGHAYGQQDEIGTAEGQISLVHI